MSLVVPKRTRRKKPRPPRRARPAGAVPARPACQAPPLPGGGWYGAVKVGVDFAAALAMLVLSAPLILVEVALVKLTSPGPALYWQTRLGYRGRPFRICKIRSMAHNCERLTGPQWSTAGDPRVTSVGRILRRLHIDELLQLWNVLKGDMSLIGPRPERPEICASLDRVIPHYRARLLVRPGLGGLAQAQLPPDTDLASVRLKLAYDLYYVQHVGLGLDLRLMLATFFYVLHLPVGLTRRLLWVPGGAVVEQQYRDWLKLDAREETAGWQAAKAAAGAPAAAAEDLDLSKMGDEALRVLAEEHGYHPAANELLLRHHAPQLGVAC